MPELTKERIGQMGSDELAENVISIFDFKDPVKREMLAMSMEARAKELGMQRSFQRLFRAANNADRKLAEEYTSANAQENSGPHLKFDAKGNPAETIDNYISVFRADARFCSLRYNEFKKQPEITERMKIRQWNNADDSETLRYIEGTYKLYNVEKYKHAIRVQLNERSYNPVQEYVDALVWDGVPRMEECLIRWMKCVDTPYAREVSRLIFAGGIHRLYDPGCKFDYVPVLIGTKQGEGKSTFVRWLAIKDDWYGELTDFEGGRGVETIQGVWMCEIGELLALVRAKEVEAVKSYLSRQVDKYRVPYAERPENYPRQCIFIGTTNREHFLTDKTGNRRFLPINVYVDGRDLFDNEKECRAYIAQCWAEAKAKYAEPVMRPVPDRSMLDTIVQNQQAAEEDDYREGMIETYLSDKKPGESVCTLELWQEALKMGSFDRPSKTEQSDIGLIMQRFPAWKRQPSPMHFTKYGSCRGWTLSGLIPDDDVPF